MGSPYAGADLFPTDFTIPDDADPPDASTFNVAFEALGDRTKWTKNRIGSHRLVAAPYVARNNNNDSTGWSFSSTSPGTPQTLITIPNCLDDDIIEGVFYFHTDEQGQVFIEGVEGGDGYDWATHVNMHTPPDGAIRDPYMLAFHRVLLMGISDTNCVIKVNGQKLNGGDPSFTIWRPWTIVVRHWRSNA